MRNIILTVAYIVLNICLLSTPSKAQQGTTSKVDDIAYSTDGKRIAIADAPSICGLDQSEYRVIVVDAQTLSPVTTLLGHSCAISDLAWSPDGTVIVSGGTEGIAIVWDVSTGIQVSSSELVDYGIGDLTWNPDSTLYIGITGGNAYVFDSTSGQIIDTHTGNTSISAISWGSNNVVAYGDIYGQIRLWNYLTSQEIITIPQHNSHVRLIEWNRQSTQFASVDRDEVVNIWDSTGNFIRSFQLDTYVTDLVWNPDGSQIIIGKINDGAEIRDVATGQKLVDVVADQPLTAIAWSPDGNQIVYGFRPSQDDLIEVVEVSTLFPTRPIADAGADITILANPNGTANVILDGSDSTDSDGAIVSYEWSESSKLLGTGISQTVTLPIGTHTIHLEVTDDSSQTDMDTIIVTVEEL
ncbi:PD40 domain-containing protein [Phototrophicus methaneseepsis]|uniref:PD40 domain-containing protein n=1 Tax=Phototrophicus methaneseepsis TaxID=2710758 RepID=A0A7S8E818_9CHLR|nr:PD40 domain-containing protein [Phototrophicus methaneseepsis]QPC82059.1 PD40 domain-containing protein [Phototrophicus methaneseepsis]